MARASRPTLLSLDRFAKIFQINPVHFAGGAGATVWPAYGMCNHVWPQWAWQANDVVSREEIAAAIAAAEAQIEQVLGFNMAPRWHAQEVVQWPKPQRPEATIHGANTKGLARSLKARWGRVISPGRRTLFALGLDAAVVFSDDDGDGFEETATITISPVDPYTDDLRKVKVYFAGKNGAPEWEIRPVNSRSITVGLDTITITADSWLFIDPALWEAYPTEQGFQAIDVSTSANYVTVVDVYYEYTDTTAVSSQILWAQEHASSYAVWPQTCTNCGGAGCPVCGLSVQDGCFAIRNANAGMLAPFPAAYNDTTLQWDRSTAAVYREPDMVRLWYQAGAISERYLAGDTDDPLDDYWAEAIAYLAASRLPKKVCDCSNLGIVFDELQRDLSAQPPSRTIYLGILAPAMITNPFGSRVGEYRAWLMISTLFGEQVWSSISI